ncbi:hypothetical protein [Pseudomonas sp. MWU12-2323]|uniref:hypothetical protein n=1 Tax=Pseudomonas sp. MWU12-2323 TaxID=2651296 RepID=UPI001C49A86A|nr:hypothetical protein [Pseudomonas sp. MWU12-2323]
MKIRVLSDLHLEYDEPLSIPYVEADLVVLAGDIHNHAKGLALGGGELRFTGAGYLCTGQP